MWPWGREAGAAGGWAWRRPGWGPGRPGATGMVPISDSKLETVSSAGGTGPRGPHPLIAKGKGPRHEAALSGQGRMRGKLQEPPGLLAAPPPEPPTAGQGTAAPSAGSSGQLSRGAHKKGAVAPSAHQPTMELPPEPAAPSWGEPPGSFPGLFTMRSQVHVKRGQSNQICLVFPGSCEPTRDGKAWGEIKEASSVSLALPLLTRTYK